MAKEEQLTGTGEGAGEKGVKKAKATGAAETTSGEGTNRAVQAEGKLSLHIANPEFDAAIGDLKVTLDKLKIPNKEQKELLAIVESTRPLTVTER